jgi:hypothetical protein
MARENKGLRGFYHNSTSISGEQNGHLPVPLKRKGGNNASNLNCKAKKNKINKTHVNV